MDGFEKDGYWWFNCGCRFEIIGPKWGNSKIPKLRCCLDKHNINHTINFDCPATWELLSKGWTKGVFQLESPLGRQWCKKMRPENLENMAALGALLRPGCIGQDTKIAVKRGNRNGRKLNLRWITISELYDKFNRKHGLYSSSVVSLDESQKLFFNNNIENVIYSGKKEVYKPLFSSRGSKHCFYDLECTLDHKLLTLDGGWRELKDLSPGEYVAVSRLRGKKLRPVKAVLGEKSFRDICHDTYRYSCIFCDWSEGSLDVNHLEGNRKTNNDPDNLCFMCPNHHRMYSEKSITKEQVLSVREYYKLPNSSDIEWRIYAGKEYVGIKDAYDITVSGPNHNFVAGNVVVHNCLRAKDYTLICKDCRSTFPIKESYKENDEKDYCPDCGSPNVKRVGTSMTEHYCKRKNQEEPVKRYHESIDPILSKTYNVLTYQEQSMQISQAIANFNLQEADMLRKCVTDDTVFVSKKDGYVTVKSLIERGYKKDLFLTLDKDGNRMWDNIVDIWFTKNQQVYEIETLSGYSINVSENHNILTNNGWKKCKDLNIEDFIITSRVVDFEGEDIIDRDLAIVICGILTEGHFFGKHCNFTSFSPDFMNYFIDAFSNTFGENRIRFSNDKKVAHIRNPEKECISRYISKGLSTDKFLPDLLMTCTKNTCADILSFLLGAEGSVNKNGQFEFTSKSRKFCYQIKQLLLRFGIVGWLRKKYNKTYDCYYYRVYVNDISHQRIMLKNLTHLWPKDKADNFIISINNRNDNGFSSDIIPKNVYEEFLYDINLSTSRKVSLKQYSNITKKLVEKSTSNKDLLKIISNIYFDKVSHINKLGIEKTYDFTMKNSKMPQVVANNMVISNSIGKKLPEEMSKVKKLFLEKSKEAGIVLEDQAEEIFGWIEKSQRYSFNKSHSASYGETGYICAYAKKHFPLAFYRKWLEFEKDKKELAELVNDAKVTSNIRIRPPDITYLKQKVHSDGRSIFFGLEDIKDVGTSQIEKLKFTLKEYKIDKSEIPKIGWMTFMMYIGSKLSCKSMIPFIKSGAFSCFNLCRSRMEKDYGIWTSLSDGEQHFAKQFFGINNRSPENIREIVYTILTNKGYHGSKRRDNLLKILDGIDNEQYKIEDTIDSLVYAEEELLGVALSCHITDSLSTAKETHSCKDIIKGYKGYAVLKVSISDVRPWKIKNGPSAGKHMAFIKAGDTTCEIDNIVAFPEAYDKYSYLISPGAILYITGKLSNKDSFTIERIYEYTE